MRYKIKQNRKTKGEKTQIIDESKVQFIWQKLTSGEKFTFSYMQTFIFIISKSIQTKIQHAMLEVKLNYMR